MKKNIIFSMAALGTLFTAYGAENLQTTNGFGGCKATNVEVDSTLLGSSNKVYL